MNKIPLLTTGLNGLVGSKFAKLYQAKYQFDSLDLRHPTHPVNITDYEAVLAVFSKSEAESVVHLAAFTNVTAAWEQRNNKDGLAYQVNVIGTQNIIQACQKTNKHLIHISTAYVFDGEKDDLYTEKDEAHPIEWYGQTKWEAEQAVMASNINWTILRIDQPFRSDEFDKTDIAHRIIQGLKSNALAPMFSNHYFGPTFVDDFAKVLDFFVRTKTQGLFHATSGEQWTDYEFAQLIKRTHSLPGEIQAGDLEEYLQTLNRPYQQNTALDISKLKQVIDFPLNSIEEAVAQILTS
jgi:dTDP-4-dehydrorhamnose reductase